MAENSVDDNYSTCDGEMKKKIDDVYFKKEIESDSVFKKVWNDKSVKKCTKRNVKNESRENRTLDEVHRQAICAYTVGGQAQFYDTFNKAVKTNRHLYNSSFPFHSLHFWLTRAIQILKNNNKDCLITYRRTKVKFTGNVNEEMRFGLFASSSKLATLTQFGEVTCFKIKTCYGAYLKKYPKLKDHEQEVLIPPYEKFKIIQIPRPSEINEEELKKCKAVYVLESAGVQSNLS